MKKYYYSFLLLIMLSLQSIYSQHKLQSLTSDPAYLKAKQHVMLLREKVLAYTMQGIATGALYGAGAGAVVGIGGGLGWAAEQRAKDPYDKRPLKTIGIIGGGSEVALYGAGAGAVVGGGLNEARRRYIIWRINNALRAYTTYGRGNSDFMKLPVNEAIMLFAAYQNNRSLMRKMVPHLHSFLNKPGMWEVLGDLYFGAITFEDIDKVSKLRAMLN